MAIVFINAAGGNATTSASTVASNALSVSAGNTLIVCVTNYTSNGAVVTGITDTAGNTYTRCGATVGGDAQHTQEIWYASNVIGNASNVVTVQFSALATYRTMAVVQYSGLAASNTYDVGSTGTLTPSGTTHTTTTATTTQADELLIGWFVAWEQYPITGASAPNTLRRIQGDCAVVDRIVSATGTYSVAATSSVAVSSGQYCMMRTFKAATGGGGGTAVPGFVHHLRQQGIS